MSALLRFPVPHLTQYDFGDLAGPRGKPYAVYPDVKTRRSSRSLSASGRRVSKLPCATAMRCLPGSTTLLIDRDGRGQGHAATTFTPARRLDSREAGIRFVLKSACDELALETLE